MFAYQNKIIAKKVQNLPPLLNNNSNSRNLGSKFEENEVSLKQYSSNNETYTRAK